MSISYGCKQYQLEGICWVAAQQMYDVLLAGFALLVNCKYKFPD